MERFAKRRFAALLLALLLAASCVLPATAAAVPPEGSVSFAEVDPPEDAAPPPYHRLTGDEPQAMSDDLSGEPLRALIVLEKDSLLEKGYAADDLIDNADAQAYNAQLQQDQADVIAAIEAATGETLDVVWRLTVVANLLSAWVRPTQMDIIAAVPGVRSVQAEAIAVPLEDGEPDEDEDPGSEGPVDENAGGADDEPVDGEPAGSESAGDDPAGDGPAGGETGGSDEPAEQDEEPGWMTDYKGDGQRIAIIDTGVDALHRSLNSSAWMYALAENARLLDPAGDLNSYLNTLDLLDAGGVGTVLDDLAVVRRNFALPLSAETRQEILNALTGHGEAVEVGVSDDVRSLRKVAFGANYSGSGSYNDIAHHDRNEHGSHVAGIAAANFYVPTEACWDAVTGTMRSDVPPDYEEPKVTLTDDAGEEEPKFFQVRGQAPNAQLLVMQVFSQNGCAESDYMAAIQDALLLGADIVNLSLGSNEPGATFARETALQEVVDRVAESGAIVSAAYGNSFYWTHPNSSGANAAALAGLLYADDVCYNTGGDPAAYDTLLAVAAAHVVTDGAEGTARMSDFSSWGVPSTLELKPEITAPCEDIASLNGAHEVVEWMPHEIADLYARHDNYEEMSGTSMATPQIAGMAAAVMEYLEREYPKDHPSLTNAERRRIAQSLLMSTAVPMEDPDAPVGDPADPKRNYYSVLQQGAGLADAKKAVTANAYITMEENAVFRPRTADAGKVKAELGAHDNGYSLYTFTVHNLDPYTDHDYSLHTDLFTQELTTLSDGSPALGTGTVPLLGDVKYTGKEGSEIGPDGFFTVPAGGTFEVSVEIQINDPIVDNYPAGAYVEGYTWVEQTDGAEGDRDVHSIPLLGFYGNWSNPAMFDHLTAYDKLVLQAAGLDPDKDDPHAEPFNEPCGPPALYTAAATALRRSYTGHYVSEQLTARSAKTGESYSLTGNPWFLEPERPLQLMAINPDDALLTLEVLALRNAILDMEIDLADDAGKATGAAPLWSSESFYAHAPWALFDAWWDTETSMFFMNAVTPQDLKLVPGDRLVLRAAAMPEYDWQTELITWPKSAPLSGWDMRDVLLSLGKGALLEFPLWVDSGIGPAVNEVVRSENQFTVTVQDDRYTAWVTVLDTAFAPLSGVEGDAFFTVTGTGGSGCVPNLDPATGKRPDAPGKAYNAEFTFTGGAPEQFIIMVGDYAGNARYFLIDTAGGEPVPVTPPPASAPAGPAQPAAAPAADEPAPLAHGRRSGRAGAPHRR